MGNSNTKEIQAQEIQGTWASAVLTIEDKTIDTEAGLDALGFQEETTFNVYSPALVSQANGKRLK